MHYDLVRGVLCACGKYVRAPMNRGPVDKRKHEGTAFKNTAHFTARPAPRSVTNHRINPQIKQYTITLWSIQIPSN